MRKTCVVALLCMLLLPCAGHAQEGSWGQINQPVDRPEGWRQIVVNSDFQLGTQKEIGVLPDGSPLLSANFGTYPSLDGSTVAVPMAVEFARQHLGLSDADAAGFVFFSTTHGAYLNLIGKRPGGMTTIASSGIVMDETHPVDVILATGPSDEELSIAQAAGITLVREPVCYDAFIFITHIDNPVDSLTLQQVRDIYAGRITNWREVGGLDEEITPFQREANSGSQTAMESLVMRGEAITAAEENTVSDGMASLVYRVGEYDDENPMALGYTYQYYLETLYKSDTVKTLAIEGVSPTPEHLRDASYPLTTYYYAVIRSGEEEAVAGRFVQWLLSGEGQQCIAQAGYVPLRDE